MHPTQNTPPDEVSVKVRSVSPWRRFQACPKCGYQLGAGNPIMRIIMSAIGRSAQQTSWCKGDQDSTVHVHPIPGLPISADIPTACFGIFHEHMHCRCGCCNYQWLMECKPAPKPANEWLVYLRQFSKWFFITLGVGALLFLCVSALKAESLPEAPRPHVSRTTLALYAADAGVRALDAYSTERALRCACNHENNIPRIAGSLSAMWLYSESIPLANLAVARMLESHHHPRLAKVAFLVDIGYDAPMAVRNLNLNTSVRPGLHRF